MRTCVKVLGKPGKLLVSLAGLALLLSGTFASAAPLTNGNFEAATSTDGATNTFPGWTETAAANAGNAAFRATTPLTGTTSALLSGTSGQIGTMSQTVDPIGAGGNTFNLGLTFAAVDPGAAGTGNRSFQLLLTGSNGGQINVIVTRGSTTSLGSVQVFSTTANAFQAIASQADKVNFSTSLASPVLNTLVLNGTVGGGYTISTNGTTSGSVNFYQGGANPTNFNSVNFTTVNATTVNYVVDDVVLTPEPASAGLLVVGAMAGLARRRRRTA